MQSLRIDWINLSTTFLLNFRSCQFIRFSLIPSSISEIDTLGLRLPKNTSSVNVDHFKLLLIYLLLSMFDISICLASVCSSGWFMIDDNLMTCRLGSSTRSKSVNDILLAKCVKLFSIMLIWTGSGDARCFFSVDMPCPVATDLPSEVRPFSLGAGEEGLLLRMSKNLN